MERPISICELPQVLPCLALVHILVRLHGHLELGAKQGVGQNILHSQISIGNRVNNDKRIVYLKMYKSIVSSIKYIRITKLVPFK